VWEDEKGLKRLILNEEYSCYINTIFINLHTNYLKIYYLIFDGRIDGDLIWVDWRRWDMGGRE